MRYRRSGGGVHGNRPCGRSWWRCCSGRFAALGLAWPAAAPAQHRSCSSARSSTPEHSARAPRSTSASPSATRLVVVPVPIREIDLLYPANLGIATSGLGISTCRSRGPRSRGAFRLSVELRDRLRLGDRRGAVRSGDSAGDRPAHDLHGAPPERADSGCSSTPDGERPVSAQLVFPGLVLPAAQPFGGDLSATSAARAQPARRTRRGTRETHDHARPQPHHLLRIPQGSHDPLSPPRHPAATFVSCRRLPVRRAFRLQRWQPRERQRAVACPRR